MAINPLELSREIRDSYIRYLTTSFLLRDPQMREAFRAEVARFALTNGPVLEATPPFKQGRFLSQMEDILGSQFTTAAMAAFPWLRDSPLHLHQERAISKIIQGQNVVVASGTGSGKTECFLVPILHFLFGEIESRTLETPGVRAVLLYPMNALANDQLRKLRGIVRNISQSHPDFRITFGRYVGDTQESASSARTEYLRRFGKDPVVGELLSRSEMKENPPHILITNYAMLEYLLLRPEDNVFFDGGKATRWKFLVLDEAHIYNGAAGIEMAMLLRRLKDRVCEGKRNQLSCIATSATLGRGEEDFEKVATFATNLFDEPFNWDDSDRAKQGIIAGERIPIESEPSPSLSLPLEAYSELRKAIRGDGAALHSTSLALLSRYLPADLIKNSLGDPTTGLERWIHTALQTESNLRSIRALLEGGPRKLEDCAKMLFRTDSPSPAQLKMTVDLVDVAVWARADENSLPLLPARYHYFVRAPEGLYMSFAQDGPPKISLERRETDEDGNAVFEIGSCKRCGEAYIIGGISERENNKLVQTRESEEGPGVQKRYYKLLSREQIEDEDEETPDEDDPRTGRILKLCTRCATATDDRASPACKCNPKTRSVLTIQEIIPKEGKLNKCFACSYRAPAVIREFRFQKDAPSAVLATSLFQYLERNTTESRRKILAFSDSRQDAAFFAPYLSETFERLLFRRLMVMAYEGATESDYGLESLVQDVVGLGVKFQIFTSGLDERGKKREVWGWIIEELCATDRRNCLEGVGLLSFVPLLPADCTLIGELLRNPWNLTPEEAKSLYAALLDTLRLNMVVRFPSEISPTDQRFQPRNHDFWIREQVSAAKKYIKSWCPSPAHTNGRLEYLRKVASSVKAEVGEPELRGLLGRIWDDLTRNWKGLWSTTNRMGTLTKLDYKYWRVQGVRHHVAWFRCDLCGTVTHENVRGVCPSFGCNGTLGKSPLAGAVENNHYRFLYKALSPSKMRVKEHTAQLRPEYGADIQQQFEVGDINILSCSTTFELGVDLGELETVFLRNVPPEPANYIQRAGRAGRRANSAGFTLTFALLRPFDLAYFRSPERLVGGRVKPPVINLQNEKIIRRHLHSIVFSRFWRLNRDYFGSGGGGSVDAFFRLASERRAEESGVLALRRYVDSRPADLRASLLRTIPPGIQEPMGLNDWGWVDDLFGPERGTLLTASAVLIDAFDNIREYKRNKEQVWIGTQDYGEKERIQRDLTWANKREKEIKEKRLIDHLASRGVLPKYGFPVDVVELRVLSHIPAAKEIQLERDLRMAISEFAPGCKVVANGYTWKSAGLTLVRDKHWELFDYAVCQLCRRFEMKKTTPAEVKSNFECKGCGKLIEDNHVSRLLVPIFGFTTNKADDPEKPGESRPRREFGSRPYFSEFGKAKNQLEKVVGGTRILCDYSTDGEMAVICAGKKGGFKVCFECGAATSDHGIKWKRPHERPDGEPCNGSPKGGWHLGHYFKTDILMLTLHSSEIVEGSDPLAFWWSLLYAVLEGTSEALGIQRRDLDGCLYPRRSGQSLVFFDNVPGGAGHVKRMLDGDNLAEIFRCAYERLRSCECGRETSCEGCLRNYFNQFCHDKLRKGLILDFIESQMIDILAIQ